MEARLKRLLYEIIVLVGIKKFIQQELKSIFIVNFCQKNAPFFGFIFSQPTYYHPNKMKTYLRSLQKSMSVNRRSGKPGLLAVVVLLCAGIALFAGSKNGVRFNFAYKTGYHRATLATAKKSSGIAVDTPVPVPVVSYVNPNVDTLGVVIDPIIPSASGVDTPGYAPYKLVDSGFLAPQGIASDTAGNIYVTDKGNNVIKKVPATAAQL